MNDLANERLDPAARAMLAGHPGLFARLELNLSSFGSLQHRDHPTARPGPQD
jgi:hypothetical protein